MRINAPKQKRSRETLTNLLDAAEELLEERRLEEITIADIVERAESSIGSFYARFPSKESLVVALMERYHVDAIEQVAHANVEWKGLSLRPLARRFVGAVVTSCRQKRGLLRLRQQLRLSQSFVMPDEKESSILLVNAIVGLFEPVRKEIRRRDRDRALAFALRMVDGTATTILMEEIEDSFGDLSDEEMVDRLTNAFVSYLT